MEDPYGRIERVETAGDPKSTAHMNMPKGVIGLKISILSRKMMTNPS